MTAIETAIKEAVEKGGYIYKGSADFQFAGNYKGCIFWRNESGSYIEILPFEKILLDPFFWQALGKAREWPAFLPYGGFDAFEEYMEITGWKAQWHRFIDHLAEGKDAESFFSALT